MHHPSLLAEPRLPLPHPGAITAGIAFKSRATATLGDARFILQGDEQGVALARPLADQATPATRTHRPVARRGRALAAQHALAFERSAQDCIGWPFSDRRVTLIIGYDLLGSGNRRQLRIRLLTKRGRLRAANSGTPPAGVRLASHRAARRPSRWSRRLRHRRATASRGRRHPARCANRSTWVKPAPRAATSFSAHFFRKPSDLTSRAGR